MKSRKFLELFALFKSVLINLADNLSRLTSNPTNPIQIAVCDFAQSLWSADHGHSSSNSVMMIFSHPKDSSSPVFAERNV